MKPVRRECLAQSTVFAPHERASELGSGKGGLNVHLRVVAIIAARLNETRPSCNEVTLRKGRRG